MGSRPALALSFAIVAGAYCTCAIEALQKLLFGSGRGAHRTRPESAHGQETTVSTDTRQRMGGGLPFGIVGISAALFVLFVYGYPRVFPWIDIVDAGQFEKAALGAVAAGDVDKAEKIAARATLLHPLDPGTYTVYGRMLLAAGKADEAVAQLHKAVGVEKELSERSYRETRKPFYFAPARLTLGEYYLKQDRLSLAAANFELARAHAADSNEDYAEYRAAQYQTYVRLGFWARALEYGEPSDEELDNLDDEQLARLARVAEGRRDWKLISRAGERLLARGEMAAQAHYLLGRVGLAQGEHAAAAAELEQAVAGRYAGAAYFHGMALEKNNEPIRALRAYLVVQPEDVYRPFALAKAITILAVLTEDERNSVAATREELLGLLDGEIAQLRLRKPPISTDAYRRLTPVAVVPSQPYFEAGGRFPVLILWEDTKAVGADPAHVAFRGSEAGDNLLLQRGDTTMLQLQWVENQVNWEAVEHLPADAEEIPGWIDTARDWFDLRSEYVARVPRDAAGDSYLSLLKVTWFGSVPVSVRDGAGYLFSSRVRCRPGRASLTWQALDQTGRALADGDIVMETAPDTWTTHAGYFRSQLQWSDLRVQLSLLPRSGAVDFDEVMLVAIQEPGPASLN